MKSRLILRLSIFCCLASGLWAAGAAAEKSLARGEYLVEQGMIISPEEIREYSYISETDMLYPELNGPFGVTFFAGHQQVSTEGQEVVLLIGIQARRLMYEDLPTVNQALVVDKSGSMYQKDKMVWVKEAFEIFIDKVREKDILSLVTFDDEASVVIPPARVSSPGIRQKFRDVVSSLVPGGGSNLEAGLDLGFQQVLSNFDKEYVNRVLFLTDGMGSPGGILEMAEEYHKSGIEISSIGMGKDFNGDLIDDLAVKGGGTSRFISSRESMEEIFGSGLSRTISPAARDLELSLQYFINPEDIETWAADYELQGQWDSYATKNREVGASESFVHPVPSDLAIDFAGNIYITDYANGTIEKFGSDGALVGRWNGSGTFRAKMQNPSAVAVDASASVFVADTGNNRILKLDSMGNFLVQWGRRGTRTQGEYGQGRFADPKVSRWTAKAMSMSRIPETTVFRSSKATALS